MELLNVVLVRGLIDEHGYRLGWVKDRLGVGSTSATIMMKHGFMPRNQKKRDKALSALSEILGVAQQDLVLEMQPKKANIRRIK